MDHHTAQRENDRIRNHNIRMAGYDRNALVSYYADTPGLADRVACGNATACGIDAAATVAVLSDHYDIRVEYRHAVRQITVRCNPTGERLLVVNDNHLDCLPLPAIVRAIDNHHRGDDIGSPPPVPTTGTAARACHRCTAALDDDDFGDLCRDCREEIDSRGETTGGIAWPQEVETETPEDFGQCHRCTAALDDTDSGDLCSGCRHEVDSENAYLAARDWNRD